MSSPACRALSRGAVQAAGNPQQLRICQSILQRVLVTAHTLASIPACSRHAFAVIHQHPVQHQHVVRRCVSSTPGPHHARHANTHTYARQPVHIKSFPLSVALPRMHISAASAEPSRRHQRALHGMSRMSPTFTTAEGLDSSLDFRNTVGEAEGLGEGKAAECTDVKQILDGMC